MDGPRCFCGLALKFFKKPGLHGVTEVCTLDVEPRASVKRLALKTSKDTGAFHELQAFVRLTGRRWPGRHPVGLSGGADRCVSVWRVQVVPCLSGARACLRRARHRATTAIDAVATGPVMSLATAIARAASSIAVVDGSAPR